MKISKIVAFLLLPAVMTASSTIGKISGLKGTAQIVQADISKNAQLGSGLIKHDQIITQASSKVQVVFQDDTIVTIGKNSQFSIDEYIAQGSESEAKLSLVNGAIRTITGRIGKVNPQKFQVKTKTATIGIRGTNFIVIVTPGEDDVVACTLGAITVTGNGAPFDVPSGFMTRVNPKGDVQSVEPFESNELGQLLDGAFGESTLRGSGNAEVSDETASTITPEETAALEPINRAPLLPMVDSATQVADAALAITTSATAQAVVAAQAAAAAIVNLKGVTTTLFTFTNGMYSYAAQGDLSYSVDTSINAFLSGAGTVDSLGNTMYMNQPTSMTNAYTFVSTFAPFSFFDGTNTTAYDASRPVENYIQTITDLDPDDTVTWGEWSIPVTVDDGTTVRTGTESGSWIAGVPTPVSVIDGYRTGGMSATYTGSLIGVAISEGLPKTSFTGTATSNVDFGADTVNTALTYSVGGGNYQVNMTGTIVGNYFNNTISAATFNGNSVQSTIASGGGFFGTDGKTIGGHFGVQDATNARYMSGVYEAKTTLIQ